MDFSTYIGLKAAIATLLNRDDLTADIPGFIVLTEASIARRVRRKTVRATLTATTEATSLPADCAELRSAYPLTGLPSQDKPLIIGTPEAVAEVRARYSAVSGRPIVAAIVDGSLIVAPSPDQSYTLQITYYQKNVPLSADAPANAILTEAPDLYLYGALLHSAPYLEHDERIPVWSGFFESAIKELDTAREREELNASYRPARLPVSF